MTDYLPCVSSCRAPLDNSSRVAKRPYEYIETARLTCKGGTSERSETGDSCDNDHISFRLTGDACAADAVQSADGPRLPGSRSDFPRPRFSLAPGSGPDGASRGSPDLATSQSRPVQGWALLLAIDSFRAGAVVGVPRDGRKCHPEDVAGSGSGAADAAGLRAPGSVQAAHTTIRSRRYSVEAFWLSPAGGSGGHSLLVSDATVLTLH